MVLWPLLYIMLGFMPRRDGAHALERSPSRQEAESLTPKGGVVTCREFPVHTTIFMISVPMRCRVRRISYLAVVAEHTCIEIFSRLSFFFLILMRNFAATNKP